MTITWEKQNLGLITSDMNYDANFGIAFHSWDYMTQGIPTDSMLGSIASYDAGANWEVIDGIEAQCAADSTYIYGKLSNEIETIARQGVCIRYNRDTELTESFNIVTLTQFQFIPKFSCSASGQYVITSIRSTSGDGALGIWVSRDYGETWNSYLVRIGILTNIVDIHISEDGKNMAVFTENVTIGAVLYDYIDYSSDYGNTWNTVFNKTIADAGSMESLTSDSTCTNMVLAGAIPPRPGSAYRYGVWVSYNSGASWTDIEIVTPISTYPYCETASSKDGIVVVDNTSGGGWWISTTSGATWTEQFPWGAPRKTGAPYNFISIMEDDGSKIWVFDWTRTDILESLDFGATWNTIKPYLGLPVTGEWLVSMDDDGTNKIVADSSSIYIYLNAGGTTWTSGSPVASGEWATVSVSGDGNYMIIGQYSGRLYLSNNSGATWNEIRPSGVDENLAWYGSAISSDGKYIIAGDYIRDDLYLSSNYGANWTKASSSVGCADRLAMSSDGSFMIGVGWQSIKISKNYGVSWAVSSGSSNWTAVDCSSSGSIVYAVQNGYDVYYSDNSGDDWTAIIDDEYGYDISCSGDGGAYILADGITGLFSHGYTSGSVIYEESVTNPKSTDMNSAGTSLIVGQVLGYVYVGIGILVGGNIKSIAGVLLENIAKVGGIPIANLKKISGEEN